MPSYLHTPSPDSPRLLLDSDTPDNPPESPRPSVGTVSDSVLTSLETDKACPEGSRRVDTSPPPASPVRARRLATFGTFRAGATERKRSLRRRKNPSPLRGGGQGEGAWECEPPSAERPSRE